jgi:endonuclease YncB( thermonuclease family)
MPQVCVAEPIAPGAIEVIDGDTIRAHGRTVRLVGFDTPESGFRARCESERTLAAKTTFRLRQLVSGSGL